MLLHTAAREFKAHGFYNTSLDQVAELLGVSKPTIYYYFKDKDELLFACAQAALDRLQEALKDPRSLGQTGREGAVAFMQRYIEVMTSDFGHALVSTEDSDLQPDSRRKIRGEKVRINECLKAILERGVSDGSIAPCNVELVTFAIFGAMNWIARWYTDRSPSPAEIAADFAKFFSEGLAPRA
ncbi:MAG TPA: TetR/AcrR family transcriptional regulator [Caulobacteraceae bacterium]|nr:TetR/AcrR family transcriptional regulator [Caulobacteraceae bacterium]